MSYIVILMSFQTFGSSINYDQVKSEPKIIRYITYFLAKAKFGPPKSSFPFAKCSNLVPHRLPSSYVHAKGILEFSEIVYDYVNWKCFIAFILSL